MFPCQIADVENKKVFFWVTAGRADSGGGERPLLSGIGPKESPLKNHLMTTFFLNVEIVLKAALAPVYTKFER